MLYIWNDKFHQFGDLMSDQLLTKKIGDEFACIGVWWIPDGPDPSNPQRKQCGTISLSQDGDITLDITGTLQSGDLIGAKPVDVIWGTSSEGELITLLNSLRVGITIGTTASTESYLVPTVLVSKHARLNNGAGIAFSSLTIQYTHLGKWAGVGGFHGSPIEDWSRNKTIGIGYTQPEPLPSVVVKNYTISIHAGPKWHAVGPTTQKATIEQSTSIVVEPTNSREIPFDEVWTLIRGIQHFLSLLTYDDPIYPLVVDGAVRIVNENGEGASDASVRMLYKRLGTRKSSMELSQHKMLFTYKDVADIWESALNKIIVVEDDKLKPVYDQFFAEYFSPSAYPEDRFMATVRAIEVFHRRTSEQGYYMEEKNYLNTIFKIFLEPVDKARSQGIISSSFRDRLKNQLYFGYEYSLRKRLDDLFTLYGEEFLTLFVDEEKGAFVNQVVDTRNWFTHFDERGKDKAIRDGKELAYLNLKLQLFMIALLLRHVGIPAEKIEDQFKHYKFEYLKRPQQNTV